MGELMPQLPLLREDYQLRERVSAKARKLRIEVRPGNEVVLVYPRRVPRHEALAFLRSREAWIREKLAEMAQRERDAPKPPVARWDGSDRVRLRGVELAVKVVPASLRRATARIDNHEITLFCPLVQAGDPARLARALRYELMQQAVADAQRYLDEEAARMGLRYARLRVNDPRTLWGSCNPSGTICLSWRLVMAPPEVFRYVAIHELCHLVHRNHSARFWALVRRQCPDYEVQKAWLREHGNGLHHVLTR